MSPNLEFMIEELVKVGDLILLGDGYFEDMGGHIISVSSVPSYFENYLKYLRPDERTEVLERTLSNVRAEEE